jgi:hypothetical protein
MMQIRDRYETNISEGVKDCTRRPLTLSLSPDGGEGSHGGHVQR